MFIASGSSEMYLKVSFKSKLNLSSSRGIKGAPERLGASGSNVASACRVQAKCLASKACLPAPLIRSPTDKRDQPKRKSEEKKVVSWTSSTMARNSTCGATVSTGPHPSKVKKTPCSRDYHTGFVGMPKSTVIT